MKTKIDIKYNAHPNYPFFLYNAGLDGFEYYKTEKERDKGAKDAIQGYLDDGWNEDVTNVVIGKITGQATMVDVETQTGELDEDGCDESGEYWDNDYEYKCNYEIKPLGFVCKSTEQLKQL